jgi:hypothetical protein
MYQYQSAFALMCDNPKAIKKAIIATTGGRLASHGGSGVMNGVTALSIRKMASRRQRDALCQR